MYEQASERWSPVQSVEKVLLSVISMLAGTSREYPHNTYVCVCTTCLPIPILLGPHTDSVEPNLESGANIDCCKLYRDDKPVRSLFVCKWDLNRRV